MLAPLVLDIETVPLASSLEVPYPADERTPPANYKSEEAIARWREADAEKWKSERVKQCSLSPRLGRIVCIGTARVDGASTFGGVTLLARTEDKETSVLEDVWARLKETRGRCVTWNGSFDLNFILLRSVILGVQPTLAPSVVSSWFKRYTLFPHFDCKAALLQWETRVSGEGLDQWAQALGLPGKTGGMTGADVWPLYREGKLVEIGEYCTQDVSATASIYQRIAPYYTAGHGYLGEAF